MIRELISQGYEISSVSGSSMGALVGGVYASGKLDEFATWLCSLSKMDVFNLVDFTFSSTGIIKADRVFKEIHKFVPDCDIEDLPIPFAAVATDFKHRKEVVITKGSLFEAIRASISIPLVITPLIKNDTLFLDGGVLNPVPVNQVKRHEGDLLVAVNLNAHHPYEQASEMNPDWHELDKNNSSMLSGFQKKLSKVGQPHLTLQMNPPDLMIEISKDACGTFDFYKASDMIQLGKFTTSEALKSVKDSNRN
ncbi:MAG: patatin-like phospholipase family protein [Deltaproteobacteria bacterium]|nr:patatin-like phospholipase family protein [Deltaproteobacteria bacterium]